MKIFKALSSRIFIFGLLMVIQASWIFLLTFNIIESNRWIETLLSLISVLVVLAILMKQDNPSYKISWIILILCFPIFGGLLYIFVGNKKPSRIIRRSTQPILDEMKGEMLMSNECSKDLDNQVSYGFSYLKAMGFGTYQNTTSKYYPLGEYCYIDLLRDLKQAKHYIFMEYFIVSDGRMFNQILAILKEKVKEGVEVRFMYDDFGSLTTLPYHYERELENSGIKSLVFNPFKPVLSVAMNHRDHRKICVIDGYIGYSGGFNLADEYINCEERFGHWKDTGIRLEGEAVWNLCAMFLSLWNAFRKEDYDYSIYKPKHHQVKNVPTDGYVVPYGDSPLDNDRIGEDVYLNLIQQAKNEILIMTPYFIIDDTMIKAFEIACKKGVKVKIITPGIPDKRTVYRVTRSYYHHLIEYGVEFYEYCPGFLHAKGILVDNEIATVGTINFDYRSLYLHFECNVLLYKTKSIEDIALDFKKTLSLSKKIDVKYSKKYLGIYESILRLFAPLM